MLNKLADALHDRMVAAGVQNAPSAPVMTYAFQILTNTLSAAFGAMLIGAITGTFTATLITLLVFATIRYLSGGYHLKSGYLCTAVSIAVLVAIPHVSLPHSYIPYITGFSIIMMLIFAPANYDKYATLPERYYPLLKLISASFAALNFFFVSELLAVIFGLQSILLLFKSRSEEE
ncbi:accessory gene regulator ArgB-like protein [Paenibacillus montanisoli]|uniref:Accessory regulator AgrB n=1 Tax=Paenibacillus montanisoli TaxID=2081970 RepID=A0A328U1C7_9BACL|nr:accessory gene regulator B family protein [Paenibacillus montanisoli]RAP76598.1 hypothetical protein DL346_14635 [Paenibacillus montanisoli]